MIPDAKFGVWATDRNTFVQSWISAGIWTAPGEYTTEYQGIACTIGTWPGIIVKTPAVLDAEGNEIESAVLVPGWHCNVIVFGQPLLAEFANGLDQYDADGNLLSVWDRTWAATVFDLTWQDADPATGYPAGYVRLDPDTQDVLVRYSDSASFKSPSNIILS